MRLRFRCILTIDDITWNFFMHISLIRFSPSDNSIDRAAYFILSICELELGLCEVFLNVFLIQTQISSGSNVRSSSQRSRFRRYAAGSLGAKQCFLISSKFASNLSWSFSCTLNTKIKLCYKVVRVYMGVQWISARWHNVHINTHGGLS